MSTLVEMIEALQKDWGTVPKSYHSNGCACWTQHVPLIARLAPLHVRAKEQEKELAALKEPKNVLIDAPQSKGICARCGKPVEVRMGQAWHTKSIDDGSAESVWHEVCSYQDAIEKLTKQHDADLLVIAEMAIGACDYTAKVVKPWPTADSIVREFREKKAKVRK